MEDRMMNSPRILQAHCQSPTSQRSIQSFVKELAKPTLTKRKRKHRHTTLAIRIAGGIADMKVITLNKLFDRRTMMCLEIPHYA
jgi:hypothetical protein